MKLLSDQNPGTYKWFNPDTQENFDKQSKEFQSIWAGLDITYNINSFGFRGAWETIPDGPYLLVIGDSFTLGIGIPFEDTWGELLGKHLNLPVINLAVCGSSIELALWNLIEWQSVSNRPAHIVWQWSSPVRQLLIKENSWDNILPYGLAADASFSSTMRDTIINTMYEPEMQLDKMYKVKHTAKLITPAPKIWRPFKDDFPGLDIPMYNAPMMFNHLDLTPDTLWKIKARDNTHWGREVHRAYADNIIRDFF